MAIDFSAGDVLEHVQLNNMILAEMGDGVISGLDVSERGAGPNMSVDVAAGSCNISSTKYTEPSIVNLAIEAAHATLHRKDLITYDPTTSNPVVTKGSNHAGGTAHPIYPPDIPGVDILLAIVNVAATETEITNSEIVDCIVEVTQLDTIAAPTDTTTLDSSTSAHGLLKKLSNSSAEFMNGTGAWTTPAGSGDMLKSVYDTNAFPGVVDQAVAATNAGKVDGYDAGNAGGQVAVSNGTLCTTLNADRVDGCHAGLNQNDILKLPTIGRGDILVCASSGTIGVLVGGTNGYQLTTHATASAPTWAAASDLLFSDTHCPKCGQEFQDGDNLILHVIGHNEVGDILTLPMHQSCANQPKKTVTLKRKVMEDRYILDELTGKLKTQRVQKTQEKTVTKHKLKEGYTLDTTSGKAFKINKDGKQGKTEYNLYTALETATETIREGIYEDVEYIL